MALRITNMAELDRELWLRERRSGLGGSDMGAIMGFNKYTSPMDVYLDKLGELPEEDLSNNNAIYFGNRLEDFVAEEFTLQTGRKVRRNNFLLRHEKHPFLQANVDRVIVAEGEDGPGILECKTSSEYLKDKWKEDEVPTSYFLQVQHYLNVTGYKYGYIAALIGGNKFFYKRIERDDELIQNMTEIAEHFWNHHVKAGVPPEWDESEASTNLLNRLYPETNHESIYLQSEAEKLIEGFNEAKENEKFWKTEKNKYANQLKGMLGEAEVGVLQDSKVTWKVQEQSRIDTKRLKEEMPEIYESYIKKITFRKFDVRGA